jgi:hypothetical protein
MMLLMMLALLLLMMTTKMKTEQQSAVASPCHTPQVSKPLLPRSSCTESKIQTRNMGGKKHLGGSIATTFANTA